MVSAILILVDTSFIASVLPHTVMERECCGGVFETGQKASDQTFANGRPEASANESRSLTYYRTGSSLDKGTSTKHPAKERPLPCKDSASGLVLPEEPEPTSQLYRTMDWCFLHVR